MMRAFQRSIHVPNRAQRTLKGPLFFVRRAIVVALCGLAHFSAAHAQNPTNLGDLSADERDALVLSRAKPPRQLCHALRTLPVLDSVIDQPLLTSILDTLSVADPKARILYSVKLHKGGGVSTRILESNTTAYIGSRVGEAISRSGIATKDTVNHVFRLRLAPGAVDRQIRVGPPVVCAPRATNVSDIVERNSYGNSTPRTSSRFPAQRPATPKNTLAAFLLVSPEGKVTETRPGTERTPSMVEINFERTFSALRFEPLLIDGEPTQTWVWFTMFSRF